jgi:hypothetical protein
MSTWRRRQSAFGVAASARSTSTDVAARVGASPATVPNAATCGRRPVRSSREQAAALSACLLRSWPCFGSTLFSSRESGKRRASCGGTKDGCSPRRRVVRSTRTLNYHEWKALLETAGLREARLHDARHTAATVLLILGQPERTVMSLMGWSSAGMTARYQHVTDSVRADVASQVGGLIWEARTEGRGVETVTVRRESLTATNCRSQRRRCPGTASS